MSRKIKAASAIGCRCRRALAQGRNASASEGSRDDVGGVLQVHQQSVCSALAEPARVAGEWLGGAGICWESGLDVTKTVPLVFVLTQRVR